jgi:hypothetical protein
VLAGHAAPQFDAPRQNLVTGQDGAPNLIRIAFIKEDQRMNVAIPGMEYIGDSQSMAGRGLLDEAHDLRKLRPWHHPILRQKIRTQPSDRPEGPLARFPERHPLRFIPRQAHFARPVLPAQFHHPPHLAIHPRRRAVQLDDQYRAGIERKPVMIRRFDRLRDQGIHHLEGAGHNAGRDDRAHGLARVVHALEYRQHRPHRLGRRR